MQNNSLNGYIHVLIVVDQQAMRSILRQLLSQHDFKQVSEANNGDEALKFIRDPHIEDPDIIICDLHMEKMDGMELIHAVRRDKYETPVLILTGDSDAFLHDVAHQAGAAKVLTIPISAQTLATEIQSALGIS